MAAPMTPSRPLSDRARFHLRFGWWSLLVFLTLGVGLEALHGFKVGFYLDADEEVRRLMWTLAHAHGALLGLVHVALAATLYMTHPLGWAPILGSRALTFASVTLPLGFFLGGFGTAGGDPGVGVVFVPVGALMLFGAVLLIGLSLRAPSRGAGR
jgi:hypothetical protein